MYLTLLNLLCLSISPISGQITYPNMGRSQCDRITEVGLYLYWKKGFIQQTGLLKWRDSLLPHLRTRRALLLYKGYVDNALLALN